MKKIIIISLCLSAWTFFISYKPHQDVIKEDEIELKEHIIENNIINKEEKNLTDITQYQIDNKDYIEDPKQNEIYAYYSSYTRLQEGIHYDKVYPTFDIALKEARVIHQMAPYNEYNTYTIEGLPQCGYKIYYIK